MSPHAPRTRCPAEALDCINRTEPRLGGGPGAVPGARALLGIGVHVNRMSPKSPGSPDYQLVAGFRFRCLPGCGLCCYTTPAVAPLERAPLIQLDPEVPFRDLSGGWAQIQSRPEGGACYFLRSERCRCHDVRPATCGEFPLTVHVSARIQVSVVLTCPGVELTAMAGRGTGESSRSLSSDLRDEVARVEAEIRRAGEEGQLQGAIRRRRATERRLEQRGLWQPESEVRERLRPQLERYLPSTLPELEPPEEPVLLESMPLFYDPAFGRVAWVPHPAGVEFLSLREEGGIGRHLGVLALPTQAPEIAGPARRLLIAYLGYVLERDATFGAAYDHLLRNGSELPEETVASDLAGVAEQVVRLSVLRRALTTDRRGALTVQDVEQGIRATDMDLLDRPTVGLRL